jgi:hypothetical protein
LANHPCRTIRLLESAPWIEPMTHPTTQKSWFSQDTPEAHHEPVPRDRRQRLPGTRGRPTGGPRAYRPLNLIYSRLGNGQMLAC